MTVLPVVPLLGVAVAPLTLYWLGVTLAGILYTGRNVVLSWQDNVLLRAHGDALARITAFTHVRSHSLLLALHGGFFTLGLNGLADPRPTVLPTHPFALATLLFFLASPIVMIVLSATTYEDRQKLTRLARAAA